jgi:hypothetical protein
MRNKFEEAWTLVPQCEVDGAKLLKRPIGIEKETGQNFERKTDDPKSGGKPRFFRSEKARNNVIEMSS